LEAVGIRIVAFGTLSGQFNGVYGPDLPGLVVQFGQIGEDRLLIRNGHVQAPEVFLGQNGIKFRDVLDVKILITVVPEAQILELLGEIPP